MQAENRMEKKVFIEWDSKGGFRKCYLLFTESSALLTHHGITDYELVQILLMRD